MKASAANAIEDDGDLWRDLSDVKRNYSHDGDEDAKTASEIGILRSGWSAANDLRGNLVGSEIEDGDGESELSSNLC